MPWFYAGPEAKPVGPVSVEELHACRARGLITPSTYVIEQKGPPGEALAWKRYQDVFPATQDLPPLPPVPAPPLAPLGIPLPPAPAAAPHPLFPSAAPIPTHPAAFPPGAIPGPHYHPVRPTNAWCGWGFWLGLVSFLLMFACGLGVFVAPIALLCCIVGLAQVHSHREQGGQYQAIWGLILSILALVIGLVIIFAVDVPFVKAHGLTVTEQTSNDTE